MNCILLEGGRESTRASKVPAVINYLRSAWMPHTKLCTWMTYRIGTKFI